MKKIIILTFLFCSWLSLSAFQKVSQTLSQPWDERQAQNTLPMAKDSQWAVLGKTKITLDEKQYTYSAKYPPEVKALNGKPMTIKGFMLPLESTPTFKHFILSKRTPTCPYCPPGEPNEIIDVYTTKPVKWNESVVTVSGQFSLINNQNFGMFFKIGNAEIK